MITLLIEKKYLWLPIKVGTVTTNLTITQRGKILRELDVVISDTDFDFYCYLNVSEFIGTTVTLNGCFSEKWAKKIRIEDKIPTSKFEGRGMKIDKRPKIHFTAEIGWINDPNGLVYSDGKYHMFFQHNPYGTEWGNMTWGHAISADLLHWEQLEDALFPDENGTMYSGCGIVDKENLLQKGDDTLLFYYTAAGAKNNWSQNAKFTQRLAYSHGNEMRLKKVPEFCIDHITGENRDPKVFYHAETSAYIMVLYLDGNDFAIFRSSDLMNWEQTQTLTLPKAWECPDLFPLCVDGNKDCRRWVFWAADGFYFIGDFDGYNFTPQTERLNAYATRIPYAAQTYSGIENRIISQSWLRLQNRGTTHTGAMAIPVELSLHTTNAGDRLCISPIKEIESLRKNCRQMKNLKSTPAILLNGKPAELCVTFPQKNSGTAEIELSGQTLKIDFATGTAKIGHDSATFDNKISLSLRAFLDYEVIEIFANAAPSYLATENKENSLSNYIKVSSDQEISSISLYDLA